MTDLSKAEPQLYSYTKAGMVPNSDSGEWVKASDVATLTAAERRVVEAAVGWRGMTNISITFFTPTDKQIWETFNEAIAALIEERKEQRQ